MTLLRYVASRIRELRLNYDGGKGLSQEALATAIDKTANTVSRWETGTYKPTIEELEKLSRFFGVSISNFFPPEGSAANDQINALIRCAQDLPPEDLEELRNYAEFRRSRFLRNPVKRDSLGETF